jgi:hypothetical protein
MLRWIEAVARTKFHGRKAGGGMRKEAAHRLRTHRGRRGKKKRGAETPALS